MKRLKTEELSKLSETDLVKKLNDMSSELSMLRSKAARGTLKKERGEIKSIRRNIARILTAQNAKRALADTTSAEEETAASEKMEEKK
jgi:large subunit ribosomal protein L29